MAKEQKAGKNVTEITKWQIKIKHHICMLYEAKLIPFVHDPFSV